MLQPWLGSSDVSLEYGNEYSIPLIKYVQLHKKVNIKQLTVCIEYVFNIINAFIIKYVAILFPYSVGIEYSSWPSNNFTLKLLQYTVALIFRHLFSLIEYSTLDLWVFDYISTMLKRS